MSNIEIEARALLSLEKREEMLGYMHTLGEVKKINRVMIDFSGENRQRTVVLRIDNGQQQLIAKTGSLSDMVRREAQITVGPTNSLEQTLGYLEIMGYTHAMLSLRSMFVVKAERVEYSMRDVLHHDTHERVSTLIEIEALTVAEGAEEVASQEIHAALVAHDLLPLGKTDWEQWVKETYEKVDRPFGNSHENAKTLTASLIKFIDT